MSEKVLPVARPLLPKAEALLPYLARIDEARVYSNFGPLVLEFERRVAAHFALAEGQAVSAANGTLALSAALIASGVKRGGKCLVPSLTFCASAHAILGAGLTPVFVDVDRHTGMLSPPMAEAALGQWPDIEAVMPVAMEGSPVDAAAWDAFSDTTGVPVVIDAAAAFANQRVGSALTMVSFHATKIVGAGEGAVALSTDRRRIEQTLRALNFGFFGGRIAECPAVNGKMSEYSAAVGLASLDAWPQNLERWRDLDRLYRLRLARSPVRPARASGLSSTFSISAQVEAQFLAEALRERNIDTRRWYGDGAHRHPAFSGFATTALETTEKLTSHMLGLPFFVDMTIGDIERVAQVVEEVTASA